MEKGCALSDKNRCVHKKPMKKSINIISWNVNGIRSKSQALIIKGKGTSGEKQLNPNSHMASLFAMYDPDILCLQETKCQCKNVDELKKVLPFKYQVWSCSTVKLGYSGIAILSKLPFKNLGKIPGLEEDTQGRSLLLEFTKFYLVNVYVPNSGTNEKYRKDVWDKKVYDFLANAKGKKKPLIYCGDLNVVSGENDIYNPAILARAKSPGAKTFERANFKAILDLGYIDTMRYLNKDRKLWTWWDMRSRARVHDRGWRLDYFLVSRPKIIKRAEIYKQIYGSDHCPIGLEIA